MKIQIENNFITDNSGECENGCFFLQTSANSAFVNSAIQKGARVISIKEAKNLLGIDENIKHFG